MVDLVNNLKDTINEIKNLYNNGEYYLSIGEPEGAIVSFSSCASMIRVVLKNNIIDSSCGIPIDDLEKTREKKKK